MGRNSSGPLVMGHIMTQAIHEADSRVSMALSEKPWNVRSSVGNRLDLYTATTPVVPTPWAWTDAYWTGELGEWHDKYGHISCGCDD